MSALLIFGSVHADEAACTARAYRALDFWLGAWEVFDTRTGAHAGESLIEKNYGGCVVRESWREPGFTGGSLNIYSRLDRKWHQTWVDSSGALREFVGGEEGGKIVLAARTFAKDDPSKPLLVRIALSANPDGSVHQYSDWSRDFGRTWQFRYDYTYRRRK
ncbi:MAG: hypothetical protein JOZ13_05160 [Alphaproteobacteria bacterium]|nr:hypothetical protein [Alphaproteobacteria bacterium]